MQRAFKTEIILNDKQRNKFAQSVGICRWLYNSYLAKNKELYQLFKDGKVDKKQSFMSANDFDKYINNEIKVQDEFKWINNCGSKARKKSIVNAEMAFKRFFKGQSKFPRFKKKSKQDVKLYFPKNNKTDWTVDRHKIKIPSFGWVQIKEKGYLPTQFTVVSGTVSQKANRFYVSVLFNIDFKVNYIANEQTEGIGIDLGLKEFAITSEEKIYKNINKTNRVRKLEKKLKREQRKLSRKYESLKQNKKQKEGTATRRNIQKQIVKVQKLHYKLTNIRTDYVNKTVSSIVKQNPSHITIEDLNVKGMMKNKHLSKAVSQQKLYQFRRVLEYKCKWNDIELRIVDRFYPSSKICSCCGFKKNDLKLSDRVYECNNCETVIDRDLNASLNLKNAIEYKIA